MATLRQAAKNFNNSRWDEILKDDYYKIPTRPGQVRLWDEITIVRQHYIEFFSEKQGGRTGFYALCLNYDPAENAAVEGGCPMCEAGLKASEHCYTFLIVRAAQKKGLLTIHPVRMTGKLAGAVAKLSDIVYNEPEKLPPGWAEENEYPPEATHQKYGFDVFLSQEEKNSKVDYTANQGPLTPLKKEERQAFQEYINDGRIIAKLAKGGMQPRSELLEKLNALGVLGEGGKSSKPNNAKSPKRDYNQYDQDDVPADRPAKQPQQQVSGGKRPQQTQGDDDGDQQAAPARSNGKPAGKPGNGAKPATKQGRPLPWDDEDDNNQSADDGANGEASHERTYATPDADDAPDESEADAE